MRIYIVTNNTAVGNYTPSIMKTFKDAQKWLLECTAQNIKASEEVEELKNKSDVEVCEWAKTHGPAYKEKTDSRGVYYTYLEYADGSFNEMEIFTCELK